jgi:molecular chaperone DnaJ
VTPHPLFERDGPDLHCEVPVQFVQAALGAEIEVPTLEGKVKMRLPEGTQSGKVIRLRGKGLPSIGSSLRGDQYVRIFVEVPTKLRQRQRELLQQFAEESGTEVSPVTRGFLEKLRDFLG